MDYIFEEIDQYIKDENWDQVMRWAEANHDTHVPAVAQKVMKSNELCIKQNIPEAYLNLGTFYYNGVFVAQDYKKAFDLYKVAADAGILRAICNCGYCFYYGRHQEKDYAKALEYFNKGALLFDDANCLYKIGDMYLNGYAVEKNEKYAFMLYERASEQMNSGDDNSCNSDIYFRLGKCYLYGTGTKKNVAQANRFLSIALLAFYDRRQTDPFVKGLIASTKQMIADAQTELETDLL